MIDRTGKVAIVTGASSGIGRASARLFARAGAKVVVAARRKAELESLVREIADQRGDAFALAGDVSDEAFAKELVERAEQSYGRLDVAFNNAGTLGEKGPTTGISLDGWNEALKVNLTSAFLAAKHQIPAMLKQGKGSIIFTSTFVGYTVGFPEVAAYASSKSGLIGLTEVLAAEYGPQNIRVNGGTACTTDTACKDALGTAAGATAQVTVSYPCDLSVMGINYKPSCTLSATSSQMVQ